MEQPANKDAPAVRRRRKISSRVHREVTPEGSKVGRRTTATGDSSEEESAVSSSTTNTAQMSRNNSTKSTTLSAHKSKILSRRDKAVANQRSQSQPRIEITEEPLVLEAKKEKTSKAAELLKFMKSARRSLSSPRIKSSSRNASPNPSNGDRSDRNPPPPSAPPVQSPQSQSLESQQLSKLDQNLRRFEEERRKFEIERRKFEAERRELDRIRLKRLEERDKKRIAEGYQQLLAKKKAKDEARKASLKASDPEESQKLIESFNKAQEICLGVPKVSVTGGSSGGSGGEKKVRKSSRKRTQPQPPDLLSTTTTVVRRSVSLRRRSSPRHHFSSSSDDADDEYGTERKSSDSNPKVPTKPLELNGKATKEEEDKPPSVEVKEVEKKQSWLSRIFGKKKKPSAVAAEKKKKEKLESEKKAEKLSKWKLFKMHHPNEILEIKKSMKRCVSSTIILAIFCGFGGLMFRFTEGAIENFYKCGAKKVKRDFLDLLWAKSHSLREEDWKSLARTKLRTFEEELQVAFDSGLSNYSGQSAWSFVNSCIYCFSVITTIGYGHIAPATNTGRAITIVYSIIGIPIFLIVLADFGKLFTRGIKFLWAYVRGLYYTGSCRKIRKTVPVDDMMKGVNIAYDFITGGDGEQQPDAEKGEDTLTPQTPMPSEIEIDDEFNLPISLALFILISYILFGAAMYSMWETWSFFESFYFVFISMSTIGFGDYVPNHPMFMMASIVYLVFGLALTSMCINVVQLKLSDSFRQASSKIRETIGLADAASSLNETPCPPEQLKSAGIESTKGGGAETTAK